MNGKTLFGKDEQSPSQTCAASVVSRLFRVGEALACVSWWRASLTTWSDKFIVGYESEVCLCLGDYD